MITITSKNNELIANTKKLQDKKYRKLRNECLLEGEKLINEAIKSNVKIKSIFSCDESKLKQFNDNEYQLYFVSENIIKWLSLNPSPQNVLAVIDTKSQYVSNSDQILILDNLQNPDNFGAIIRTALATNFNKIFAINCVDKYNEKVLRASMGTIFRCEIIETDYQYVKELSQKYDLYYADMKGENIFNIDLINSKVGIVIGNEGNGISKEIRTILNNKISIPMENNVESLNATVAGSIIMYQIYSKINKK